MIDKDLLINGGKYLFILYLVISGNYLGNLFGCRVQDLFTNNMLVKHLLGFLTFYFFITVADSSNKYTLRNKFLISITVYLIFILSTKIHYKAWYVMIISLALVYILHLLKDEKDDPEKQEQIKQAESFLVVIAAIVIVLGFIYYIGEKKIEYGKDFNLIQFILGAPSCKGNPLEHNKNLLEVMKTAFL
jgi:predicted ferric reductase